MHFFGGERKGGHDGGRAFCIGALHRPAAVHGSLTEYPSGAASTRLPQVLQSAQMTIAGIKHPAYVLFVR